MRWRSRFLASVISRSAAGRNSFAFATVVTIRSWVKSAARRFRLSAFLWAEVRPSARPRTWWRMVRSSGVLGRHPEREAELGELLLNLGERRSLEALEVREVG